MVQLIFGLILTVLAMPVLMWVATNYGLLDHPDERKHHQEAIPLVGGLAMTFAIAVSAAWQLAGTDIFWGLFVSISLIVLVGALDDRTGLPVWFRFLAQGIAALIMALFAGAQLASLGDLLGFGPVALGTAALPFTIFSAVGMANAINLSDGMDGLAGGLALVATAVLAVAAYLSGRENTLVVLLILGGALIGFLSFNMRLPWQRRARVFMGDSGSLMLRRMLKGRSPFHPGRDHLHHILLRVGYSDSQVVHFIHLVAVGCGLIGFAGWRGGVPDALMFYGFLAVFALYCVGVRHAWKLMRLIMPHRQNPPHA